MGGLAPDALAAYPARDDASAYRASNDLLADRVFGWQNWTWAHLARQHGTAAVFYYDWLHPLPMPPGVYAERRRGAMHGSEMLFAFGRLDAFDWAWQAQDRALADMVQRYWVNFAISGDPNAGDLPHWPAFDGSDGPALQFTDHPVASAPTRQARFAVLDAYFAAKGHASIGGNPAAA